MILIGIPTRVHQRVCSWNVPAEQAAFQHRSTYIHCPLISNKTVIQLNKKKMPIKKKNHLRNLKPGISFWSALHISSVLASSCLCAVDEWEGKCWKEPLISLCWSTFKHGVLFLPGTVLIFTYSTLSLQQYAFPSAVCLKNPFLMLYSNLLSFCDGKNINLISELYTDCPQTMSK